MQTVLFVDDEPFILDALRRLLHPERHTWGQLFAVGGDHALKILRQVPIYAVVTDMHMPGMSGQELLNCVCREHPDVVRIVLSGHYDPYQNHSFQSLPHYILTKPCSKKDLLMTLEDSLSRRSMHA